jgi:hypothetical protein
MQKQGFRDGSALGDMDDRKAHFLTLKALKILIVFALPDPSSVIFKGALILV